MSSRVMLGVALGFVLGCGLLSCGLQTGVVAKVPARRIDFFEVDPLWMKAHPQYAGDYVIVWYEDNEVIKIEPRGYPAHLISGSGYTPKPGERVLRRRDGGR